MRTVSKVMPEAFRLRNFRWQLFATLTFRSHGYVGHKVMLFTWLRDVAHSCHIHFKYRLVWLARYELGRIMGAGHYHLCIAGLPPQFVKAQCCRVYESSWWQQG